jgi:hypothetical protein
MKSFLAVAVAVLALLVAAAPASSMPIRGSDGPQLASQRPATTQPATTRMPGDDGTDTALVLLVAGGALMLGAGLGFTVAHRVVPA